MKEDLAVAGDLAFALRSVGAAVSNNVALRDVSFELPTGYVMGLIGANGAGKTIMIRCLFGMRPIDTVVGSSRRDFTSST